MNVGGGEYQHTPLFIVQILLCLAERYGTSDHIFGFVSYTLKLTQRISFLKILSMVKFLLMELYYLTSFPTLPILKVYKNVSSAGAQLEAVPSEY